MRLAGNDTHLLGISREVEHAATVAAAGRRRGAGGGGVHPAGGLPGDPLHRRPAGQPGGGAPAGHAAARGGSVRRVHGGPAIPGLFVPLRIVEAYRALAAERGVAIPPAYERRATVGRRIEAALLAAPSEPRPCHNDLLNANFIDDGERIRIVDWEYAGMGDPYFDLGNFSINHELPPEADEVLLEAYAGAVTRAARARLGLMRIVSDFREAMWGVLQQGISELDVDFVAYADEHFERLLANASGPAFERRLTEAADA